MTKPVTRMTKKIRAALEAIPGVTINHSKSVEVVVTYIDHDERTGETETLRDCEATEASRAQVEAILGWPYIDGPAYLFTPKRARSIWR